VEHERTERDGHVFLIMRSPEGAVVLEAWPDEFGEPLGVLGLHKAAPMHEGQQPGACEYLPEGECYHDASFAEGKYLARRVLAGYDGEALTALYQWFTSRISIREESS
jgi:hypothetical protein